jgi:hypothetical protein
VHLSLGVYFFFSSELSLLFLCFFYMPDPGDKSDFIEEWYKACDEPDSAHWEIGQHLLFELIIK